MPYLGIIGENIQNSNQMPFEIHQNMWKLAYVSMFIGQTQYADSQAYQHSKLQLFRNPTENNIHFVESIISNYDNTHYSTSHVYNL